MLGEQHASQALASQVGFERAEPINVETNAVAWQYLNGSERYSSREMDPVDSEVIANCANVMKEESYLCFGTSVAVR